MELNTRKERFSLAYINVVATHADCEILEPKVDRGSVDGFLKGATIREVIGFQAKATSRDIIGSDGTHLHFPLPMRDYDNLRVAGRPFVLIVVVLPDEVDDWLILTDHELCLRSCGYWISLVESQEVSNIDNVTIRIPTDNIFSSGQLTDLMNKVTRGEPL